MIWKYLHLPTTILSAACLCSSCVEMRNRLTCDDASETRRSWRALVAKACPSYLLLPSASCSQLGLWPTSFLAPSLSQLQSSLPIPNLFPFPPRASPTSSPPPSPSPACSLSSFQPLGVCRFPTFSPPCISSRASFLPHLQVVWRSGVCQGGRALVRPKCGGSQETWCFLTVSSNSPGPGHHARLHVLPVADPSPLQRSVSRSGCFDDAETGDGGRAAGPRLRWPFSPGPLCCCQSREMRPSRRVFFQWIFRKLTALLDNPSRLTSRNSQCKRFFFTHWFMQMSIKSPQTTMPL